MCANYEPISKDRVHLLDLFEPTFEYSNDIYPGADCPLLFSNEGNVEWRQVKFGLIPTRAKDLKICRKLIRHGQKQSMKNQASVMLGRIASCINTSRYHL